MLSCHCRQKNFTQRLGRCPDCRRDSFMSPTVWRDHMLAYHPGHNHWNDLHCRRSRMKISQVKAVVFNLSNGFTAWICNACLKLEYHYTVSDQKHRINPFCASRDLILKDQMPVLKVLASIL